MCAIIGGTFTVAGIIDSVVFTASSAFKKAQIGKLSWCRPSSNCYAFFEPINTTVCRIFTLVDVVNSIYDSSLHCYPKKVPLVLPQTLPNANWFSKFFTGRLSSKFLVEQYHHSSSASLHYLVKCLCSEITFPHSWLNFYRRLSRSKQLLKNIHLVTNSIILFTDEKIYTWPRWKKCTE